MKICRICGASKPLEDFYANVKGRDGKRPECKACTAERRKAWYAANREREIARVKVWQQANPDRVNASQRRRRQTPERKAQQRAYYLGRKYGITLEEYETLLEDQGGVCAICRRPPREDISLHVDHDHVTGARRGLLCFRCNNSLGDLEDDPDLLRTAAAYLDAHDPEVERLTARTRERLAALRS